MIELVVFDMAGTTVDEDNVVYKTVRSAINSAGYSFTQDQVQEAGAGKEKSKAIRDVLALDGKQHSDEEVTRIFSDFKLRLQNAYQDLNVREQAGCTEVFQALRQLNVKVVLNTGYDRATAEGLIRKIGWTIGVDFDALVTASDVVNGRPAPDMIHQAMKLTGVQCVSAVAKVGDSQIDIQEGQNAGCSMCIGITTGAQTEDSLLRVSPTAVIHSLKDLIELLGQQTRSSEG